MDARQHCLAVSQLKKYVDILTKAEYPCAIVYGTRDGMLASYRSAFITDVNTNISQELMTHEGWKSAKSSNQDVIGIPLLA